MQAVFHLRGQIMINKNQSKLGKSAEIIQLLFFLLILSTIATPSRSQSSDFLNRSEQEIRQENQQELDEKFNRTMDSAIDLLRRTGGGVTADEEIFLTQECQEGIQSACDYLREIEQNRLRR